MSEVINVVVALAVIVFVVRWAASPRETPEEKSIRTALGFRPKVVTPDMTETISGMFPDLPRENIHYDLLRSGSVEQTTNKIIERGYLDAPPPTYFRLYPRPNQQVPPGASATQPPQPQASNAIPSSSSSSSTIPGLTKSGPSLISRYQLEDRLPSFESGRTDTEVTIASPEQAGGKATWEKTPEAREASLRERKAQMVLAARRRLIEQQKAAEAAGGPGPSSSGLKSE